MFWCPLAEKKIREQRACGARGMVRNGTSAVAPHAACMGVGDIKVGTWILGGHGPRTISAQTARFTTERSKQLFTVLMPCSWAGNTPDFAGVFCVLLLLPLTFVTLCPAKAALRTCPQASR